MTLAGNPAGANGTEALGPASIPIADGTGFVMAGTGMWTQPADIEVNIPAGATVKQVIAYWEGHHTGAAVGADNSITLDGQAVAGTLIGGPTLFFTNSTGPHWSSTYRADVTALNLVTGPGLNVVTAAGMSFDQVSNGVGLLVIIDDGGEKATIGVRDGNDLAFHAFAPPLNTTTPQTFTFPASADPRTADLGLFASSVAGQDFPGQRPNAVDVTVNGVTTRYGNLLQSNDGLEWDTLTLPILIPAGATSLTVQILSTDPDVPPSGNNPASLAWNTATLSVPNPPPPADAAIAIKKYTKVVKPPPGGNVCTTLGNKPRILVLEYVGGNVQSHSQAAGNVIIEGNPGTTSPVRIQVATKKTGGVIYEDQVVALNGLLTIDTSSFPSGNGPGTSSRLPTNMFIRIFSGGTQIQYVQFHTSCSQPLVLGDRYGSLVLTSFTGQNGTGTLPVNDPNDIGDDADTPTGPLAKVGDTIVWTYLVTNPGDIELTDVVVKDDNGTPGVPGDDFNATPVLASGKNVGDTDGDGKLDPGEEWRFTATGTAKLGQYANLGSVSGKRVDNGDTVTDDDPSHYLAQFTDELCKAFGKPKAIKLTYVGGNVLAHHQAATKVSVTGNAGTTSPVRIVASEKAGGTGLKWFDGNVTLNSTFEIKASNAGKTALTTDTHLTIYSGATIIQKVKFHTSCSQPLYLGDRFGSVVISGYTGQTGGI